MATNQDMEREITEIRLNIVRLQKDCTVLRMDHDRVDKKLTEAYEKMSISVDALSNYLNSINRSIQFIAIGFVLGYGVVNWQDVIKVLTAL